MQQTKYTAGTLNADMAINKILTNFNWHLKNAMSASKYKKESLINFNKRKTELKTIKYKN